MGMKLNGGGKCRLTNLYWKYGKGFVCVNAQYPGEKSEGFFSPPPRPHTSALFARSLHVKIRSG